MKSIIKRTKGHIIENVLLYTYYYAKYINDIRKVYWKLQASYVCTLCFIKLPWLIKSELNIVTSSFSLITHIFYSKSHALQLNALILIITLIFLCPGFSRPITQQGFSR